MLLFFLKVRRAQPGPSVEGAPRASSASDPAGRRRGKVKEELYRTISANSILRFPLSVWGP